MVNKSHWTSVKQPTTYSLSIVGELLYVPLHIWRFRKYLLYQFSYGQHFWIWYMIFQIIEANIIYVIFTFASIDIMESCTTYLLE